VGVNKADQRSCQEPGRPDCLIEPEAVSEPGDLRRPWSASRAKTALPLVAPMPSGLSLARLIMRALAFAHVSPAQPPPRGPKRYEDAARIRVAWQRWQLPRRQSLASSIGFVPSTAKPSTPGAIVELTMNGEVPARPEAHISQCLARERRISEDAPTPCIARTSRRRQINTRCRSRRQQSGNCVERAAQDGQPVWWAILEPGCRSRPGLPGKPTRVGCMEKDSRDGRVDGVQFVLNRRHRRAAGQQLPSANLAAAYCANVTIPSWSAAHSPKPPNQSVPPPIRGEARRGTGTRPRFGGWHRAAPTAAPTTGTQDPPASKDPARRPRVRGPDGVGEQANSWSAGGCGLARPLRAAPVTAWRAGHQAD